nr:uncharacterized protein LOC124218261 isoform X1 [Neodiprion pinetum]
MARISNGIEVVCINTFAIGEFREVGWRLGGAKISNSNLGEPSDAARYNTLTEKHSHSTEIRLPSAQVIQYTISYADLAPISSIEPRSRSSVYLKVRKVGVA